MKFRVGGISPSTPPPGYAYAKQKILPKNVTPPKFNKVEKLRNTLIPTNSKFQFVPNYFDQKKLCFSL